MRCRWLSESFRPGAEGFRWGRLPRISSGAIITIPLRGNRVKQDAYCVLVRGNRVKQDAYSVLVRGNRVKQDAHRVLIRGTG